MNEEIYLVQLFKTDPLDTTLSRVWRKVRASDTKSAACKVVEQLFHFHVARGHVWALVSLNHIGFHSNGMPNACILYFLEWKEK